DRPPVVGADPVDEVRQAVLAGLLGGGLQEPSGHALAPLLRLHPQAEQLTDTPLSGAVAAQTSHTDGLAVALGQETAGAPHPGSPVLLRPGLLLLGGGDERLGGLAQRAQPHIAVDGPVLFVQQAHADVTHAPYPATPGSARATPPAPRRPRPHSPPASSAERRAAASMAVRNAARTLWSSSARMAATLVPPGLDTCSRSTVGCSPVSRIIVAAP